jgi:hypothetical protein
MRYLLKEYLRVRLRKVQEYAGKAERDAEEVHGTSIPVAALCPCEPVNLGIGYCCRAAACKADMYQCLQDLQAAYKWLEQQR